MGWGMPGNACLVHLTLVLTGCASGASSPSSRAPSGLGRLDRIAFYTVQKVLSRDDVREMEVHTICLGMGRAGSEYPSPELLAGFSEHIPPVLAPGGCRRTVDTPPLILSAEGTPALMISVLEIVPIPGSASARIQVEASGAEPRVLECSVRETGRRFPMGSSPSRPISTPPPSVVGCLWIANPSPIDRGPHILHLYRTFGRGVRMAKEPVLKTGARKRMWVRVPPPPFK